MLFILLLLSLHLPLAFCCFFFLLYFFHFRCCQSLNGVLTPPLSRCWPALTSAALRGGSAEPTQTSRSSVFLSVARTCAQCIKHRSCRIFLSSFIAPLPQVRHAFFFSSFSNNTALTQSCSWPAFYAFPVTVTPSFDTPYTTASTCCHRSSSSTSFTITVERMSACIGSTFNTSCRTSRLRTCHHHCQHVPAPCRGFRQHVRRGQEGVVAVAS